MALLKKLKGDDSFAISASLHGLSGKFAGGPVAILGSNKTTDQVYPANKFFSNPIGLVNTVGAPGTTGEIMVGFSSMSTNDALVYPWLNTPLNTLLYYGRSTQWQNLYASVLVPNPDTETQTFSLNLWRHAISYQLNLLKLASRMYATYNKPADQIIWSGFESPQAFGTTFYAGSASFWTDPSGPSANQRRIPPLFICQATSTQLAAFSATPGNVWPLVAPTPKLLLFIARGIRDTRVPASDPRQQQPILFDFRNERAAYTLTGGWNGPYDFTESPISPYWKAGPIPFQNDSYLQNFTGQLGLFSQTLNNMTDIIFNNTEFAQRWSNDLLDVLSETNPKKLWIPGKTITRSGFFNSYASVDELGPGKTLFHTPESLVTAQKLSSVYLTTETAAPIYWDVFPYDDNPPFEPDFSAGCRTAQVTLDEIEFTTIDGQAVDTIIPLYPLPLTPPYGPPTSFSPSGKRNPPPGQPFIMGRQVPPLTFNLKGKGLDVELIGTGVLKRDKQFDGLHVETYTSGGQPFPFSRHDQLFYQGFLYFK